MFLNVFASKWALTTAGTLLAAVSIIDIFTTCASFTIVAQLSPPYPVLQ
jgi:hypothetical protein